MSCDRCRRRSPKPRIVSALTPWPASGAGGRAAAAIAAMAPLSSIPGQPVEEGRGVGAGGIEDHARKSSRRATCRRRSQTMRMPTRTPAPLQRHAPRARSWRSSARCRPGNRPNIDRRWRRARRARRRTDRRAARCPAGSRPRISVRRPPMRSAMKPKPMRLTMPAGQHQRQHLRAARHAVTEIAAIGDDMDLRHRHRDAAGDARNRQRSP